MIRQWICLAFFASTIASAANGATVVPASYSYSIAPYQYYDESGHDLTDGVLATPITGDPVWVGFGSSGGVDFDLGSVSHVDLVSVHAFDRQGGAGIMLADHITLYSSNDGTNYTPSTDHLSPHITRATGSGEQGVTGWIDLPTNIDTRYLRATFFPKSSWQFISEIELASVPEPSSIITLMALLIFAPLVRRRPATSSAN